MVASDAEVDHAKIKDRVEVDPEGLKELKVVRDRIAEKWRAGTFDILQQKNPELLRKFDNLESQIDSLLILTNKTREIKKKWAAVLSEYEKVALMCITFASRHTS